MKSFSARTTIDASPETVWAILTNGAAYTDWNTTVDSLEGRIAPGESLKLKVKANPGRAFPVKVREYDPPRRMTWAGGMPLGLFKGVRTFTLAPAGSGTDFAMEEVFSGPLAPLIGRSIPDLQPAFNEFAQCLKMRAESDVAAPVE
jgi:hypothetical protein